MPSSLLPLYFRVGLPKLQNFVNDIPWPDRKWPGLFMIRVEDGPNRTGSIISTKSTNSSFETRFDTRNSPSIFSFNIFSSIDRNEHNIVLIYTRDKYIESPKTHNKSATKALKLVKSIQSSQI